MEMGVRGSKKLKAFKLQPLERKPIATPEKNSYLNKTPLSLAAESGNIDCIKLILDMVIAKRHPRVEVNEPLTLATKARSPQSVLRILNQRYTAADYQGAVLVAIRDMYPDCLATLLSTKGKDRNTMIGPANLYHVLYSQTMGAGVNFDILPVMTHVLITSGEDVNADASPGTYPLYSLLYTAFCMAVGKHFRSYLRCVKMLLEGRANPNYNEDKAHAGKEKKQSPSLTFSRPLFTSAMQCALESARLFVQHGGKESTYSFNWMRIFVNNCVKIILAPDKSSTRPENTFLFDYMDRVCELGVDQILVRALLRCGSNPDARRKGKYPINIYFDKTLAYLKQFQVPNCFQHYQSELDNLMLICRVMSQKCLKEAFLQFLDENMFSTPVQGVALTRYFCHLVHPLLQSPPSLVTQAAHSLWGSLGRNQRLVRRLPVSENVILLILP